MLASLHDSRGAVTQNFFSPTFSEIFISLLQFLALHIILQFNFARSDYLDWTSSAASSNGSFPLYFNIGYQNILPLIMPYFPRLKISSSIQSFARYKISIRSILIVI